MTRSPDPSRPAMSPDQARSSGQGLTFGVAAELYERGRPSYPVEVAQWLVPSTATTVLDLAAGTGKFTRQLAAPGREVIAVDPDASMLAVLKRELPTTRTFVGSGEAIPLPDASVDAITVAQGWHWIELDTGVPEVARVLRPGGTLGLVWNVRNETEPWVAALGDLIHQGGSQDLTEQDPIVGPPFEPLQTLRFAWTQVVTIETFMDMIASRSYVIVLPDDERADLLGEVRRLVLDEPGFHSDHIELPYVTHAYRTRLPA